jgi:hypothetical protein
MFNGPSSLKFQMLFPEKEGEIETIGRLGVLPPISIFRIPLMA